MAYRADIEIAVRGAQQLRQLKDELNATARAVESVNNFIENFSDTGIVRSINTLRSAVSTAAAEFDKVAVNTDEAVIAARQYIKATDELNTSLQERLALLRQIRDEERGAGFARAGIRPGTQYAGPIGPGPASTVALSSQLRGRTESILRERQGAAELSAVLSDLNEKQRQLENSKLDQKAAQIQAELDQQAAAAAETAAQIEKLKNRQQEFIKNTDEAAAAARRQTAEWYRQQRVLREFQRGARASTVEFGPGGPGFSGGFTPAQRAAANQQAQLRALQAENAERRKTLELLTREELFELRLAGILERNANATARARRGREAASNAIIGGAFPLLFGQGLGASLGGGVGGAVGGVAGGGFGFGLSLVGTALGQFFDTAAAQAAKLGQALNPFRGNVDEIVNSVGLADTVTGDYIKKLQEQNNSTEALAVATEELTRLVGVDGVRAYRDYGTEVDRLGDAWTRALTQIGVALANFLTGPLATLADTLERANAFRQAQVSTNPEIVALRDQFQQAQRPGILGGSPAEVNRLYDEIVSKQLELNAAARQQLETNQAIASASRQDINLLDARIERAQLSGKLDNDAVFKAEEKIILRETDVKIQEAINKGLSTEIALRERDLALLELKNKRQKDIEDRAEKARQAADKAARDAERAQREAIDNYKTRLQLENRIYSTGIEQTRLAVEYASLDKSALDFIKLQEASYQAIYSYQSQILENQRRAELANAKPSDVAIINQYYYEQQRILETQLNIDTKRAALRRAELAEQQALLVIQLQRAAIQPPAFDVLATQQAAVDSLIEKYPVLGSVADSTAGLITFGFDEIISGTKSVEQVFADFLRNIANALLQAAQQMIAQYILIGIARRFAFGGGVNFTPVDSLPSVGAFNPLPTNFGGGLATGGPTRSNTAYMVGEQGPELFIPNRTGTVVPNNALGGATNVIVNVDAKGTSVQGDQSRGAALGRVVAAAVQAELIKQKRPGGFLTT